MRCEMAHCHRAGFHAADAGPPAPYPPSHRRPQAAFLSARYCCCPLRRTQHHVTTGDVWVQAEVPTRWSEAPREGMRRTCCRPTSIPPTPVKRLTARIAGAARPPKRGCGFEYNARLQHKRDFTRFKTDATQTGGAGS
jgi:hypothetical protein